MNRIIGIFIFFVFCMTNVYGKEFAGYVSSASPEATEAGIKILENGGNAFDAAISVSLALGASEPAGSGIFGQTVMLVQPKEGEPFVIHGTTLSPANIPDVVSRKHLTQGRTASTIPSNLKVLSFTHKNYGSGQFSWNELLEPAIDLYENGILIGNFRYLASNNYRSAFNIQKEAADIFLKENGSPYLIGEIFKQPKMAKTLKRIAELGAEEFYRGEMAKNIAKDMSENGGWITYDDLANFPDPKIIPTIQTDYKGYEIHSLPPPYGGWIMLQILKILEQSDTADIDEDNWKRRIELLNAMRLGHGERTNNPVSGFYDYGNEIKTKISEEEATRLLNKYKNGIGGETTHFSVVDGDGNAIAVTQSIDSYFGSKTVHPEYGFLYNNYMQSFRLEDDGSPYVLKENEMPLSSMSATIVKKNDEPVVVLGSPASARIISAVAQVTSYWIDVEENIAKAVAAFRVHVVPDNKAYIEGPTISNELLSELSRYGYELKRPNYGVSNGQYDPYFGGVHALAKEKGVWTGTADPRRDGISKAAWK